MHFKTLLAGTAAAALMAGAATAKDLTVVSWGGAYTKSQVEAYHKPWQAKTGKTIIKVNPRFFRPAEVELLLGDPTRAQTELGWERKVSFEGLVEMMVQEDYNLLKAGVLNH